MRPADGDVVVIGAGQAGLAVSHELSGRGRGARRAGARAGRGAWRGRWDSFCLVTPNWTVRLPGGATRATTRTGTWGATRSSRISSATRPRRAPPRGRRGHRRSAGCGWRVRAADERRPDRRPGRRRGDGRLPAPAPAARRGEPSGALLAIDVDGYRNPAALPGRSRAGRRQRPVGLPDRRGAPARRPRRVPGLRPGAWAPRRFGGRDLLLVGARDRRSSTRR